MKLSKLFAGLALAGAVATSFAQQVTLRLGMQLPETHPSYKGAMEIKRTLEDLSKGAMTVKVFPNSQLGDFKAMVSQVQAGDLDMAMTVIFTCIVALVAVLILGTMFGSF